MQLTPRHIDFIIASCRLWQRPEALIPPDVMEIAGEHGEVLSHEEIDTMIEAFNGGGFDLVLQPTISNEDLLQMAREAQTEMWARLRTIEGRLDIEIDSTQDLADTSIEQLVEILGDDGDDFFQAGQPDSCEFCKSLGHACIDHEEKRANKK